jgi:Ribbon-helix-helix protein, copG family
MPDPERVAQTSPEYPHRVTTVYISIFWVMIRLVTPGCFDENLLNAVDRFAASAKISRSAIIREALTRWIQKKEIKEFEEQWIQSIKKNPDDSQDADAWIHAQHWSD